VAIVTTWGMDGADAKTKVLQAVGDMFRIGYRKTRTPAVDRK
jgi:hypothetical protein